MCQYILSVTLHIAWLCFIKNFVWCISKSYLQLCMVQQLVVSVTLCSLLGFAKYHVWHAGVVCVLVCFGKLEYLYACWLAINISALQLKVKNIVSYNFMLHIYMLKCSSFMQVKCNWYTMGTTVLTVKRTNCKTPLPEVAWKIILWKNCSLNPTTNLKEKYPTRSIYSNQICKATKGSSLRVYKLKWDTRCKMQKTTFWKKKTNLFLTKLVSLNLFAHLRLNVSRL